LWAFHDIFISQIVGKFPRNFSGKYGYFPGNIRKNSEGDLWKFPNLQPSLLLLCDNLAVIAACSGSVNRTSSSSVDKHAARSVTVITITIVIDDIAYLLNL